jgi:hypothetical protein
MSACARTGAATDCLWIKPIYISTQDQLTLETARQILSHNIAWEKTCR